MVIIIRPLIKDIAELKTFVKNLVDLVLYGNKLSSTDLKNV